MTPGGGRGWFHRRRSHQNEPVEPAPEVQPVAPAAPTLGRDAGTDSPAPIDANGVTAPPPSEQQVVADVPGSPEPSEQRIESTPSAPIDWDAATAAALSDEGDRAQDMGVHPLDVEHGPDRLLEDLIREIVGDAAVDTATSLHPEPSASSPAATSTDEAPAAPAEPPTQNDGPDAPSTVATEMPTPSSLETASGAPVTAPVIEASVDEAGVTVAVSAVAEPDAAQADEPVPAAEPAEMTASPATGEVPPAAVSPIEITTAASTAEPTAAEASTAEPVEAAAQPNAAPDVSRETSIDHGGTPLAYELADETRRRIALEEAVLPRPAKTRVLTISNQKGGVGKTTTAVNLAAALARSGARVLVIDLDPQGNASTALGVDHRSEQRSVYEVLVSDLPLAEVIQPSTEHDDLDCVPATIHLAGAEIELVSLVAREQRLRRALDAHLASMDEPYHYVFIDCPPSLGLLTINAFVAAREVLIPIQCEYYALEGLSQLLSNIELIEKHLNPELRLSTILLTMYDSRTNLAQQVAQEVRDHFPTQTLETIIPRSVRVSEAPSYGQSVISYDFASSGSLSYREAAAEIARRGAAKTEESN